MLRQSLIALTVFTAGLAFAAAPAHAQSAGSGAAPAGGGGITIATANPVRIFNEMQEKAEVEAKLKADRTALAEEEKKRREKIQELQGARDLLKAGTPQHEEANKKLLQAAVEFEAWGKIAQAELERQKKQSVKTLYDKISDAVNEVAQQRGITLVIAQQGELPENVDRLSSEQLAAQLLSRDVLYSAADVDISNDVLAVLDRKYKERQ